MKHWPTRALLATMLWFAVTAPAQGFGWDFGPGHGHAAPGGPVCTLRPVFWPLLPAVSPPLYGVPVVPGPPASPVYATPTPAPPSTTAEPPTQAKPRRAPAVHESRSLSTGSANAVSRGRPEQGRCRAGFWNVTGRDLKLTVNGQQRFLPRDRALTLEVDRQFSWQMDNHPPHQE